MNRRPGHGDLMLPVAGEPRRERENWEGLKAPREAQGPERLRLQGRSLTQII
jgi:hypothetical protein